MMGGTIGIRSKLGMGTTADVSLPLSRAVPESETVQINSDTQSIHLGHSDSIQSLREEAPNFTVAIFDPFGDDDSQRISREHTQVLTKYVEDWYGFLVRSWDDRAKADILIIDGRDVAQLDLAHRESAEKRPAVIVMWSDASRHSQAEADAVDSDEEGIFEYLAKPCGPHKLAKALYSCLQRMKLLNGQSQKNSLTGSIDDSSKLSEIPLSRTGSTDAAPIGKEASGSQICSNDPETRDAQPCQGEKVTIPTRKRSSSISPLTPHVQNLSSWSDMSPPASPDKRPKPHGAVPTDDSGPRLLLVDDNKINLQLLQTFMRKRKYKHIDSAEDGSIAVSAFKAAASSPSPVDTGPYDMVFMDISMPVMNGFEATRAIRQFEAERNLRPAVIVALTGLASARDEAEGFAAGCDVYLTKPLSFKELSKFLSSQEKLIGGDEKEAGR